MSELTGCAELQDEAREAPYEDLPIIAQELVAEQCSFDDLLSDFSAELVDVVGAETVEPTAELRALADAVLILQDASDEDEPQWRKPCTNAMWATAYMNLIEVFGYSSEEAFDIANEACNPNT